MPRHRPERAGMAHHLRVQEAVTANAAMPLVAGEDVRTPLGAFRVVFGIGHFGIGHFNNQPRASAWQPTTYGVYRCAVSGHAVAPPSSVMNLRRIIRSPRRRG